MWKKKNSNSLRTSLLRSLSLILRSQKNQRDRYFFSLLFSLSNCSLAFKSISWANLLLEFECLFSLFLDQNSFVKGKDQKDKTLINASCEIFDFNRSLLSFWSLYQFDRIKHPSCFNWVLQIMFSNFISFLSNLLR